jgi:hypothetical protein
MNIKIDKNISIPEGWRQGRSDLLDQFPFAHMEIGDSFAVPLSEKTYTTGDGYTVNRATKQIRAQVAKFRNQNPFLGMRFSIKSLEKEGIVRCWRVQ